MITLSQQDLTLVSFPDTTVTDFSLDQESKYCRVKCSDGFLKRPSVGVIENVEIVICNFKDVTIREFALPQKQYVSLSAFHSEYALRDICEFVVTDERVVMSGFSKVRGQWTEYFFDRPKLAISYEKCGPAIK